MVRPVCVEHTDLCHRRISVFLILKILLYMFKILDCHSKSEGIIQCLQLCLWHILEAIKDLHICRFLEVCNQSLRLCLVCDTGINRVYNILPNCLHLLFCHITLYYISCSCLDDRCLLLVQKLDTLLCRIRTLIKLSRKIFL